jgi:hypothetical protein
MMPPRAPIIADIGRGLPKASETIDIKLSDIRSFHPESYQAKFVQAILKCVRYRNYNLPTGGGFFLAEVEWAYQVARVTKKPVLVIAPVLIHSYFADYGAAFPTSPDEVIEGINVINYEQLHKFQPETFIGVVSDITNLIRNYTTDKKKATLFPFLLMPTYHYLRAGGTSMGMVLLEKWAQHTYPVDSYNAWLLRNAYTPKKGDFE